MGYLGTALTLEFILSADNEPQNCCCCQEVLVDRNLVCLFLGKFCQQLTMEIFKVVLKLSFHFSMTRYGTHSLMGLNNFIVPGIGMWQFKSACLMGSVIIRKCGLVGGSVSLWGQALRSYAQAPRSMEETFLLVVYLKKRVSSCLLSHQDKELWVHPYRICLHTIMSPTMMVKCNDFGSCQTAPIKCCLL